MTFLLRYWRVLAAAAAAALILYAISHVINKAEARGYAAATAEMAAMVATANAATMALELRQREQSNKAAVAWESKRNELQSQVNGLLARGPVVRLCRPASSAPLPGASGTPGSFDEPTGKPIDAVQAGPDIGSAAVVFGGECERYRRQLSDLQSWVTLQNRSSVNHP